MNIGLFLRLAMFSAQSAHLIDAIAALPEDVRALAQR